MDKDSCDTGVSSSLSCVSSHGKGSGVDNTCNNTGNADARTAVRQRVLKSALIDIGESFAKIPCRVRNVSDTGALIDVEEHYVVPDKFILTIPMDGLVVKCEIVRRHGTRMGLQYVGEKTQTETKTKQFIRASTDPHVEQFIRKDNYWVSSDDECQNNTGQSNNSTEQLASNFHKRHE